MFFISLWQEIRKSNLQDMKSSWGLGSSVQPMSPHLLFHCHGGGYVATSSKSHEVISFEFFISFYLITIGIFCLILADVLAILGQVIELHNSISGLFIGSRESISTSD